MSRLRRFLRRLLLLRAGVTIAPDVRLEPCVFARPGHRADRPGTIAIDSGCALDQGVVLEAWGGSIHIHPRAYLGPYTVVFGQGGVEIGEDSLISMHCRILSSEHTVPALDRCIRWEPDELKPTRIGRDVWLGAGVTVLGGVNIGDGCVVGAGAIVTKDLPPGSIALGVPARIVGKRPPARPSA